MLRSALILIISSVFLVGCTVQTGNSNSSSTSSDQAGEPQILSSKNATASVQYEGSNTWSYVVSIDLPNPCYDVVVTPMVAESFPEQVTLKVVSTSTQDEGTSCAQVIKTVTQDGTYNASSGATIMLDVK